MRVPWLATGLFCVAIGLVACGPNEGDPCSPEVDRDMECNGGDALLCLCDEPDGDGGCPGDEGHWEIDTACSCDSAGHVVCS